MSWSQIRYEAGYDRADEIIKREGLVAALEEYTQLEGASAVNEYEVGFRTRVQLEQERLLSV